MLIQDQNRNKNTETISTHSLGDENNTLFDDDQKYYESVSVDLEQEEFNKLQYYKNIINHLMDNADQVSEIDQNNFYVNMQLDQPGPPSITSVNNLGIERQRKTQSDQKPKKSYAK